MAKRSKAQASLVELGHIYLDVAKVGPLYGVLGPAALHQDGQLLGVASVVGGGPKEGLLAVPHLLYNLCSDESTRGVGVGGSWWGLWVKMLQEIIQYMH